MAEEVVIGIDRSGKKATVLVNENGYVELFRATDNPERLVISDFTKQGDIQSAGLGTQNYFATNAPYANRYTGTNKKLYKFSTNIKPNEILDISPVSLKNKHPKLYTLIFGENEIRNTKAIQDNIETIKELGYKAIGNRETGSTGLLEVAQYEIIPLTTANETYNIKPIATLQTKEGFAAGKSPEAFIETSLDTPTNVVDDVMVTRGLSNAEMAIPTNADGNIILYRSTADPNISIVSDFTDIGKAGQAGLGKQNYFAIDEMYAYLYSRPSINKNVYKFETNIKANQVLNLQSPTAKQLEVLSKIGINEEDLKNWYMQITGESKVNTAIQNNLDYLLDNDIKAIGNNLTGPTANVFEYEIVPIITEKTTTEIKPVSQLILDPKWEGTDRILNVENELFQSKQSTQYADKYLPTDVNNKDTKYRPVYYVDEEGIGRREKTFQFSEQPLENNLVRDNLIEVPTDTPTNVELVKDTYVINTDTPTNVVDERKFYNPSDDVDEFGLPLTNEAKEEIRSLDNKLLDDSALNGLTMPESPQELLETGKPGNVVLTEDGYKFIILPDGQLTDGDMVYGSLRELRDEVSTDIIDTLNPEEYKIKLKEYKDLGIEFTDTPTNVVGNEFVDNIVNANTQLVDDLPLSETVKNQFDNVVRNRAKNLATPGGVIDAVDVWEIGVLGLMITAIAYKEFDEIPTIFKRTATNMFNSMTSMYNIPPVPLEQYDLDYEFIEKVITTGEKVMPTDIIIKKVQEKAEEFEGESTASGYAYMTPSAKNTDTMETTQKIQPGVQEEKMFEEAKPKKTKSAGGSGAKIL